MTKQEIDKIKKAGLENHLLAAASSKLWDARKLLEKAQGEKFADFKQSVDKARECITDAERESPAMSLYKCPKCGYVSQARDGGRCPNMCGSLAATAGSGHVEVESHKAKIGDEFWSGGKVSRWIPIETRSQQLGVSIGGYLVRRKSSDQNSFGRRLTEFEKDTK